MKLNAGEATHAKRGKPVLMLQPAELALDRGAARLRDSPAALQRFFSKRMPENGSTKRVSAGRLTAF